MRGFGVRYGVAPNEREGTKSRVLGLGLAVGAHRRGYRGGVWGRTLWSDISNGTASFSFLLCWERKASSNPMTGPHKDRKSVRSIHARSLPAPSGATPPPAGFGSGGRLPDFLSNSARIFSFSFWDREEGGGQGKRGERDEFEGLSKGVRDRCYQHTRPPAPPPPPFIAQEMTWPRGWQIPRAASLS